MVEKVLDYGVMSVSVSQKDNIVKIGVAEQEIADELISYLTLSSRDFDCEMVEIFVDEPVHYTGEAVAGHEIRYKEKWLFFWVTKWTGTIGFNATLFGIKGIVTCEHVAPLDSHIYDENNQFIGISAVAIHNGLVDVAFVPFEEQDDWTLTNAINYGNTYRYITHLSSVIEGQNIETYGKMTGRSFGTVVDVSYTVYVRDMYFFDVILHTSPLVKGDSGGPIVKPSSFSETNVGLVGINFAAYEGGGYSAAIKIYTILNTIDLEVVME